ncbi:MAG: hypothetical protein AAB467_01170 [Patescibacteria group bacterium]
MATARYPRLDEEFQLILKGDLLDHQPKELPRICGYPQAGYHFTGKAETGVLVRKLKLVSVEQSFGWISLGTKLAARGKSPSGQWIMAFLDAYPDSDGRGRVGIYDDSWTDPKHDPCYPCILKGKLCLPKAVGKFSQHVRWIVYA